MAGVKGRSGGARVGAGKKRRDPAASWLAGDRQKKPSIRRVERVEAPTDAVPCPKYVDDEARLVWSELAPLATAAGTLEPRTAMAFADLCAYIVLERKLRAAELTCAGPDHRGMMARVDSGRVRFRLIADGKGSDAAPEVDEWAEFDQPLTVVKGGKS
jgi:hypothetical protein